MNKVAAFPDHFDVAVNDWLGQPALTKIIKTLEKSGGETRIVGGAVRDAILMHKDRGPAQREGISMGEIDLATTLSPESVMSALKDAGLRVIPTGLDHGTVTAVIDHVGYEITTLRHDLETDGRHAKVAFTDDWAADAARRDFTINALYVDLSGKIYDYHEGRKDLASGLVRFIGDPEARIREDVLRILRFFRFYAWFGVGAGDQAALTACKKLAPLIDQLSVERVWREIIKLLTAENPLPALLAMEKSGVLAKVLPEAINITRCQNLIEVEQKYGMPPSPLVRLSALIPHTKNVSENLAERMKLSKREADKLIILGKLAPHLHGKLDPLRFRQTLYETGADAGRDAAMLVAAEDTSINLEPVLELALNWECPTLPIQGGDILKLGMKPGPGVGDILRAVEAFWRATDFHATRDACLAEAKKHIGDKT